MDKDQFWQTIEDCRKEEGGNDKVFLMNIRKALDKMTASDIIGFEAYQNVYMKAADFPAMREAAALINNDGSDDGFLCFRAWLVSQGKDIYYEAFKNPDSLHNHPKLRQDPLTHETERCDLGFFIIEPMGAYKDVTGYDVEFELFFEGDGPGYYRKVEELEKSIAVELGRDLACDECMKIQHKPEELEMAYPQLAARCHNLGYDPKDTCIWQKQYPIESRGLQM